MRSPLALLALVLQLLFAALPGEGLALCLGGHHGVGGRWGAIEVCEGTPAEARTGAPHACDCAHRLGGRSEPRSSAASDTSPGASPGASPGDGPTEREGDGHGVHVSRGALQPWHGRAPAPPVGGPLHAAAPITAALAPAPRPVCVARGTTSSRRAPPPGALALAVVRVTELRI